MRKNLLLGLILGWIAGGIVLSILLTDNGHGTAATLFEGFLFFALYVLGSILLCGLILAIGCMFSREGRKGLSEYFSESVAKREIKRSSKRLRKQRGFWKYFCRGLGFGAGWSMFNDNGDGGF